MTTSFQRRRDAALRLPPLPDGRRDPDAAPTDAPDADLDTYRDAWTACRSICDEHRDGVRSQIQRRATERKVS